MPLGAYRTVMGVDGYGFSGDCNDFGSEQVDRRGIKQRGRLLLGSIPEDVPLEYFDLLRQTVNLLLQCQILAQKSRFRRHFIFAGIRRNRFV